MKILIAAASFARSISGVQRHAFNLTHCLLLQPEISAVHLVVAPWQLGLVAQADLPKDERLSMHVGDMTPSSPSRNLWYYRELPKIAAQLEVDAVHFSFPMPLNAGAFLCPTVVSLHDLYPYEIPMNFGFPKFIFNRLVLQQCLRRADSIACVSEATYFRLRQYVPNAIWRKSIRIYNCVERKTEASAESPLPGWKGEPFLLCIAQHRRNKNVSLLIKAFHRLLRTRQIDSNTKLVIIGIPGPESPTIHQLIAASGLRNSVHLLEGLSEPNLLWCYLNCESLVAPSITEGFGLPVAEALLAGCRVVCSDIPAHREIGDGNCHFVSLKPEAEAALAYAISSALRKPKPTPLALPQLSGPELARQYVALYRQLIVSAPRMQNKIATGSIDTAASGSSSLDAPDQNLAVQCRGK